MPTQAHCPQCITPCLVADEHLGRPVQCYKCGHVFTVSATGGAAHPPTVPDPPAKPPTPPRLAPTGQPPAPPAAPKPTVVPRAPAAPARKMPAPRPAAAPTALTPTTDPSRPLRLDIGGATSAGRVRERNEDSFLIKSQAWCSQDQHHEVALVVVADGMGGHEAGDYASGLAVRTIGAALGPLLDGALSGQIKDAKAGLQKETVGYAIQEANREIYRKGKSSASRKGMGTTLAVVLIWDGEVLIGHVGDCRVYHGRGGKLSQLTKDQTLVARMVELGTLTPEEAADHPARNEVSSALGNQFNLEPAFYQVKLERGDWLLAASDGLHAHVDGRALQEAVGRATGSAVQLAHDLVDLVDLKGGSDNCTVAVAHAG